MPSVLQRLLDAFLDLVHAPVAVNFDQNPTPGVVSDQWLRLVAVDFQAALDSGRRILLPQHPITAYAHKNPEEAFCEVAGLWVARGKLSALGIID